MYHSYLKSIHPIQTWFSQVFLNSFLDLFLFSCFGRTFLSNIKLHQVESMKDIYQPRHGPPESLFIVFIPKFPKCGKTMLIHRRFELSPMFGILPCIAEQIICFVFPVPSRHRFSFQKLLQN